MLPSHRRQLSSLECLPWPEGTANVLECPPPPTSDRTQAHSAPFLGGPTECGGRSLTPSLWRQIIDPLFRPWAPPWALRSTGPIPSWACLPVEILKETWLLVSDRQRPPPDPAFLGSLRSAGRGVALQPHARLRRDREVKRSRGASVAAGRRQQVPTHSAQTQRTAGRMRHTPVL